jgi:hypothetical protein
MFTDVRRNGYVQWDCGVGRLVRWSYGVMVSTLDSESSDPGSNPGRTSFMPRASCHRRVLLYSSHSALILPAAYGIHSLQLFAYARDTRRPPAHLVKQINLSLSMISF